jgi:GNAT superfamily N-acetyltransferase
MQPTLTLSDQPEPEAEGVIGRGLAEYNAARAGYADHRHLHVLVRDPDSGVVLGGLTGRTSLGMLFIDLVHLPESLRGQDIGTRMLAMAEAEARQRGCRAGVLFTISFQAPGFYQKLGWQVFGEVACEPPGTSRVFLTKTFG